MRAGKQIRTAVLAVAAWGAMAHAQALTFDFMATVTGSNGFLSGVTSGMSFQGSFSYDPLTPATPINPNVALYEFGTLSAQIGSHSISSDKMGIVVLDNFVGPLDSIEVASSALTIDGVAYPTARFGFVLETAYGNGNVLTGTALPTSFDLASFNGPNGAYGSLRLASGFNAPLVLGFAVTQISAAPVAPVPEPEIWAGMLGGLALLGAYMKRRRGAAGAMA